MVYDKKSFKEKLLDEKKRKRKADFNNCLEERAKKFLKKTNNK